MEFDGSDDGDIGEISDEQIEALKKNVSWREWKCARSVQVADHPHVYDNHLALVTALRINGDLDALRDAFTVMAKQFPLPDQLWLQYIRFVSCSRGRELVQHRN